MVRRWACVALLLSPTIAWADGVVLEGGVSQRVPGGLSGVAEGVQARAGWSSSLSPGDAVVWSIETGASTIVTTASPASTAWVAVSAGLWREFGASGSVRPFVAAAVEAGLARRTGGPGTGDTGFTGARAGGGVSVPAGPGAFLLGGWLVANEAGPGLLLTVAWRTSLEP